MMALVLAMALSGLFFLSLILFLVLAQWMSSVSVSLDLGFAPRLGLS